MYMDMLDVILQPLNLSEPCVNDSMQKKPDVYYFLEPLIYTLVGKK